MIVTINDNEKAAVAAGLWVPGRLCDLPVGYKDGQGYCLTHGIGVKAPHVIGPPDMHDPANLWRVLENCPSLRREMPRTILIVGSQFRAFVFAALVALYDAEDPVESAPKPA